MSKKIKNFKEHFEDEDGVRIREQRKSRSADKNHLRNAMKSGDWSEFEEDWDDEEERSDIYR